jgi:outer membrane protein assembly factor BamB
MNGEITALNADTGKVLWKFQSKSRIVLDPVYKNGEIYAAGERTFYLLDAESGKEKWRMEFESPIKTAPSLVGDDVVMALKNGEMVSLNPSQRKRN